jgi:RNA polymerase sigma factor (sigma-70 family)
MSATSLPPLLHRLARLAGADGPRDLADADLLERFRVGRDPAAFALLVERHGRAVLGTVRRLLGNAADADDAFQATFLVLLRKAGSVRNRASLASWLHGVAFRVAAKARTRRAPAAPLPDLPARGPDPGDAAAGREACALLDEEIGRLPERYRAPLVLCGLEGKTYAQAARELGWPKSSLAHRLKQAEELLRERLTRRGVAAPAALLAAAFAASANANAPALLILATVRLATQALAGERLAGPVATLARGVSVGPARGAWVASLALAALVGLAAAGAGLPAPMERPEAPPAAAAEKPAGPAAEGRKDREGFPLPAEALARVGSARLRHARWLRNLSYSPDGKLLASSGGGRLRLWDAATGRLVQSIAVAEDRYVRDGLFSADGKTVVALDGETCRWFDVATGKEVRRCAVRCPKTESHAHFAPHGAALAVVGTAPGQDLVVYDLPSGKERFRKKTEHVWFWELAFSPDGKQLAAVEVQAGALKPKRTLLLDAADGKPLGEFDPGELFREMAFSPDGKQLLGLNFNTRALLVWELPGGKALHRLTVSVNAVVTAAFTPDGRGVLVGSQGLDAVLLDLASGKERRRFRTWPSSLAVAFAPDGKTVALGVGDGAVSQWELATGKRHAASADPVPSYSQVRFDADGKLLWAASDTFVGFDWRAGREVRRLPVPHEGTSAVLALSPDRSRLAGVNGAGKPTVWDAASGKELCVLPAPNSGWTMRAFAPDGKTLFTGEWQGPVRAWDVSTGQERPAIDKEARVTRSLVVSPDGRWLAAADHPQAAGSRAAVAVWDLASGRLVHRLQPRPEAARAWGLAFSPDGTRLAAVGGDTYRRSGGRAGFLLVWDLRTGQEQAARTGLDEVLMTVAFSADGRTLVTGDDQGGLALWELASGQERHRFTGHEQGVHSVAFSPDGGLVAAASADAPLFVWDVTGRHGRPPSAAPFSAEEQDRLWQALAGAGGADAFQALRRLLARPAPAVALLAGRLRPAAVVDAKVVRQHLSALDSNDFAARRRAAAALAQDADRAEPQLRQALHNPPSAEAKRQIEALLQGLTTLSPERLREVRAVEALERVGTPEARKALEMLAGGAAGARLTREAKEALRRLAPPAKR